MGGGTLLLSPELAGASPPASPGPWGAAPPPGVMLTLAVCRPPGHRGDCRGLRHPRRGHCSERGRRRLGPAPLCYVLLDLSGREYTGGARGGGQPPSSASGVRQDRSGGAGAPGLFETREETSQPVSLAVLFLFFVLFFQENTCFIILYNFIMYSICFVSHFIMKYMCVILHRLQCSEGSAWQVLTAGSLL